MSFGKLRKMDYFSIHLVDSIQSSIHFIMFLNSVLMCGFRDPDRVLCITDFIGPLYYQRINTIYVQSA